MLNTDLVRNIFAFSKELVHVVEIDRHARTSHRCVLITRNINYTKLNNEHQPKQTLRSVIIVLGTGNTLIFVSLHLYNFFCVNESSNFEVPVSGIEKEAPIG